MVPIMMPQVGQDIPSATVVEWRKREHESVQEGEVVVVVESEKAVFDVEADVSGVLLRIVHQAGEEVPILTPIGYIGQAGEDIGDEP